MQPEQTTQDPAVSQNTQVATSAPQSSGSSTFQLPETWPGAFGVLAYSKRVVKTNLWTILALNIVTLLVGAPGNFQDLAKHGTQANGSSPFVLIGSLLSVWLSLALTYAYLAGIRSEKASILQALGKTANLYIKGLVNTILVFLLMALSLVAFIVPFFFVLPRLSLCMYYIVDRNLGPIEAIKASWHDSKGFSLKIWGIIAVSILFGVLVLVLVGIYLLFVYQAALAVLYAYIARNKKMATLSPETQTAPTPSVV